jgi:hypothetical protein
MNQTYEHKNYTLFLLYLTPEILATHLDESWTRHFQLPVATHQSLQILDFYNDGTCQNLQTFLLNSSK